MVSIQNTQNHTLWFVGYGSEVWKEVPWYGLHTKRKENALKTNHDTHRRPILFKSREAPVSGRTHVYVCVLLYGIHCLDWRLVRGRLTRIQKLKLA